MNTEDQKFLRQALDIANRGRGLAAPNPIVGAVVLDSNGAELSNGFYTWETAKHAEVTALEGAGELARGGTLYVSLEPCCFEGRTPPCTDTILRSGIRRVVAATEDPHPKVRGDGFATLRRAGIEVICATDSCPEIALQAQRQNEAIFHFNRTGRPLVTLKAAVTLDGKIAASNNTHDWITSDIARNHVQQIRHDHDAILTGIGTVLTDDCLLTDRTALPRHRPLMRILVDSCLRLPLNAKLVESFQDDLIVVSTSAAPDKKIQTLRARGISVHILDGVEGRVDLQGLMKWIGKKRFTSLLIEAGSKLNCAALDAEVVDKILLYYAPKIFGSAGSVSMVDGASCGNQWGGIQFRDLRVFSVGLDEFAVEAYPFRSTNFENEEIKDINHQNRSSNN